MSEQPYACTTTSCPERGVVKMLRSEDVAGDGLTIIQCGQCGQHSMAPAPPSPAEPLRSATPRPRRPARG